MATLTGAQSQATGRLHAALLCNCDSWEKRACEAGRASGDLVHPLPYCPDLHFSDLKSPVADLRNSSFDLMQGPPSSVAGLFIDFNLDKSMDINWLHFDIASPAVMQSGERATGFGPALLASLFACYLNVPLLKVQCS